MKIDCWPCSISTAALILVSTAHAQAPDYPTIETMYPLQGDTGESLVRLYCTPQGDTRLDCQTMQLTFVKPDVESQYAEEELVAEAQEWAEALCQQIDRSWDDISEDPAFREELNQMSPSEKRVAERMVEFCAAPNSDARNERFKEMFFEWQQEQRSICSPRFIDSSVQFRWEPSTGQWRSVVEGDVCGVVTVQTIESEDGIWWSYSSRTIVTDPDGKAPYPFSTCNDLSDPEPLVWASRGNAIRRNCKTIGESWTR